MTVLVETARPRGRELRRCHDRGRPLNQPLSLTLTASEALWPSPGLTDPENLIVTYRPREGRTVRYSSAQDEVAFQFDIGAAYG